MRSRSQKQLWSRVSAVLIAIAALYSAAAADVAPDPGFANVSANLILESDSDLSAYRFFLESALDVEEIKVNSGAPTMIEAAGHGGSARYAKLIAIRTKDINGIPTGQLETKIRKKEFPNAVEILSHSFQVTVPIAEKSGWEDPVYRISTSDGEITATPISGGRVSPGKLTYSIWQFVWPVAVAAILLAAAVAITGVWIIRRSSKKAAV